MSIQRLESVPPIVYISLTRSDICPTTPHPITGEKVPLTFGHEFSGVIEEIGEGVEGFKVGERVCVEPIIWDGTCPACVKGLHNACDGGGFIGLSGKSCTLCRGSLKATYGDGYADPC